MQRVIQRLFWGLVWAGVFALALYLNLDMIHEGQHALYALVALCLLVASASLYYTFTNFRNGDIGEAFAALSAGVLALGVCIVSESSFWSASIENVHEQITREKSLNAGQDIVRARRRAILSQSAAGKLPGQIEAEIAVASARDIPALRAQLKASKELQALEGQVFADSTAVVPSNVKRSFYKFAQLGSETVGGSVQLWATGIVIWMVITMTVLHFTALYIGWAPGRRVEARTAPEASPAPMTLKEVVSPVTRLAGGLKADLAAQEVLKLRDMPLTPGIERIVLSPKDFDAFSKALDEPQEPNEALKKLWQKTPPWDDKPDPSPKGGQPAPQEVSKPEEPAKKSAAEERQADRAVAFFDEKVVDLLTPKARRKLAHEAAKKKPKAEGSVIRWLDDCTSQTPDRRVKATSQDCRKSYMAWCGMNGLQPVGHKQMSRIISVELCRGNDGARGPRNGKGAVFPGLLVAMPSAEPMRKRA